MKKDRYKIAVVGAGPVGKEIVTQLLKRQFPMESLTVYGRSARNEMIGDTELCVHKLTTHSFSGKDIAFFAGTEGEKGAALQYAGVAMDYGCVVIDNGSDFRMDSNVPIVIPEINHHVLGPDCMLIANPNCSTAIALMALDPLHRLLRIKRIIASTYQAVSGSGSAGIEELATQTRDWVNGEDLSHQQYPHVIHGNVIPAIGKVSTKTWETDEEAKMRNEIRKILGNDNIGVTATCVRVPVINGHSISLNVEFHGPGIDAATARAILSGAPGVSMEEDPVHNLYPMPINATGRDNVLVGRIRDDPSAPNCLNLWCAGDNLLKGAALNAVQIAELLVLKWECA